MMDSPASVQQIPGNNLDKPDNLKTLTWQIQKSGAYNFGVAVTLPSYGPMNRATFGHGTDMISLGYGLNP